MRYGIISDIHGNLEALETVLGALAGEQIDVYLCLGDIVGYGANPNECLERVWELTPDVIAGNHDYVVVGRADLTYFNRSAAEAALWTMQRLTRQSRQYLRDLPLVLRLPDLMAVHATPSRPEQWGYILSLSQAAAEFSAIPNELAVCFIGHSHEPVLFEESDGLCRMLEDLACCQQPGSRHIVNVGSVGQPRDGDPRAAYGVYDTASGQIEVKRIEYDIVAVQKKIRKAGLPEYLAERLAFGR